MAEATTVASAAEMGRRQQEAVARMIEMQRSAGQDGEGRSSSGAWGGWSTDPNVPRQNRAPRRHPGDAAGERRRTARAPARPIEPPARGETNASRTAEKERYHERQGQPQSRPHNRQQSRGPGQQNRGRSQPRAAPQQRQTDDAPDNTTLLQDILGAVGLDDDRVLILGLILILINSKADTTLILALCYLLL